MDATLKGIPLTKSDVAKVFGEILSIDVNDGVSFQIVSIKDIRLEDFYSGFRLNILSKLDNNKTYISVELTTGDVITPKEMKYNYNSIFEDKMIPIMSYTLETILAEKFETIITRGIFNTRLKDFYDIYILINERFDEINKNNLKNAIINTFKRRKTIIDFDQFDNIINDLSSDNNMKKLWQNFALKNAYAEGITYEDTIKAIKIIIDILKD